jgi:hypothetical protein
LWLLLHYEEVEAAMHRSEVIRELERCLPGYAKGMSGIFGRTRQHLMTAIRRAARLSDRATAYSCPAPYTNVASLVQRLVALRS